MERTGELRALVSGASSGIGMAFARALARRGRALVIVARRAERLASLRAELGGESRVLALPADLAQPGAVGRLRDELQRRGIGIDLLVNNAGIGSSGRYADEEPRTTDAIVALNVRAAAELLRAFLPEMLARRQGAVINVCSMSAFQPVPFLATYAASKAFLLSLSESVAEELRGSGVTLQALCPGLVQTEFQARAGTDKVRFNDTPSMSPEFVAESSLRALAAGRSLVIPGWRDRFMVQLQRLAPRVLVRRAAAGLFHPPPQESR
jgi:short-subunit dehydrogenase